MTALDIQKYIDNALQILSTDRYLELEKVLTERSDKNEKENEPQWFDVTASIIAHNDKNEHSHYTAFIPLIYTKDKPETIEDFLKKYKHNPHYFALKPITTAGTWEARYEFSMNFIALFLDECVSSSFSKYPEQAYGVALGNPGEEFSEDLKILKFFLAEIYEHTTDRAEEHELLLHTFYFSAKRLRYAAYLFNQALNLFHRLILNGKAPLSDEIPVGARYRDIYTFKSFDILLNSLKEYKQESATKLLVLISSDFSTFVSFFHSAYTKALRVENTFNVSFN
jgi:hypothetical protein